jgi:hypothetical protein
VRTLQRVVAERAEAESQALEAQRSQSSRVETEYSRARQTIVEKYAAMEKEARADDESRRRAIVEAAMAGENKARSDFAASSRRIAADFDTLRENAKNELNRARNAAAAELESGNRKAADQHRQALKPLAELGQVADGFRERLAALAADYQKFKLNPEPPAARRESYERIEQPVDDLFGRLGRMENPLKLLEGLIIPRSVKGAREVWVFLLGLGLMLGLALWLELGLSGVIGLAITGLALGGILRTWLVQLSKSQLGRLYDPLMQSLADADALNEYCREQANARYEAEKKRLAAEHEAAVREAKERHARTIRTGETVRDDKIREINNIYAQRVVDVQTAQAREMREAVDEHDRRMAEIPEQAERNLAKLEEQYRELKEQVRVRAEKRWASLSKNWRQGIEEVTKGLAEIGQVVDEAGLPWDDARWENRPLPRQIPPLVRLGTVPVDLSKLPGGLPADPGLREGIPTRLVVPAIRPFPEANLLIEAPADGRSAALELLQAQMFRLLTGLPPGMVRFTIVDPVGIGRHFGAFMHLVDFDPALVTNQVWTDPRQIEERLAELEAHMATVTQKYLRNEYPTIEAYNAVAGELAEPYRVLVVADFPSKFDEKAAARLAAIAAGGVPCGVLVMVAVDPGREMPPAFSLQDLRGVCTRITWDGGRLGWDDPVLGPFPMRLDPPPPADFATREIQRIGAAARDAKRVEVPFDFIAPPHDQWWRGDSRAGIDIPLGKSGATKRQHLALGQGTSQHVLVAGRTGSGKSTLMHALITNLALRYSPDELDLYLIDFKKGVEFKVYATHQLPHASVVAIESEREFGISVLQRLDNEMRLRADRFREAGVQDVSGYRNVPGAPPLPRIMLLVDEFQEFFVEEDKLAQDAALLLDRLVRQGRAFGVHVLLGSQSLGGAFTLARSTLGQMAVRIALQCSEVDSLLILAENNLAAKWLSRPGEAIYNDANGAPEGNHFFQVVWLADERREAYLDQIAAMGRERRPVLSRSPIVFEGDAPAALPANPPLKALLDADAWPEDPRSAQAWLGDAVAIKDPTSALFRRQGGNHLLVIGQNDQAALGVTQAALVSLAAQFPPAASETVRSGARFWILDGTPEDHPEYGALAKLAEEFPHDMKVGGWRDAPGFLAALAGEIALRQRPDGGDGPELFLFVHDLARFRDLRRREDDFGFGRRDEDAGPPDHLDFILREGPGLGVHLVAWCDTVNNLNRSFTHQQLREFEMRVLFQMSPNDSGAMLDSPAASKLGRNRALFFSEEQNRLEKFRPYGLLDPRWLREIGLRMRERPPRP